MTAQDLEKPPSETQYLVAVKNLETAARYFQKHNYEKAMEIFAKLASGAVREGADRARVHWRLCEQKLSRPAPPPKTAQAYFTLGVAALNARNLDGAVEHLTKADKLEPNREYVQYALAAACALQGNKDAALEHLRAAITLRPENRFQALHDEDSASLASDRRFKQRVGIEVAQVSL